MNTLTQLNIYPVETLRDHHGAAAYAAPTLSVKCTPAVYRDDHHHDTDKLKISVNMMIIDAR